LVDAFYFVSYLTVNTCLKNLYFKILDRATDNSPFLNDDGKNKTKESLTKSKGDEVKSTGSAGLQGSAFEFTSPFLKPFSILAHNISLESIFLMQP